MSACDQRTFGNHRGKTKHNISRRLQATNFSEIISRHKEVLFPGFSVSFFSELRKETCFKGRFFFLLFSSITHSSCSALLPREDFRHLFKWDWMWEGGCSVKKIGMKPTIMVRIITVIILFNIAVKRPGATIMTDSWSSVTQRSKQTAVASIFVFERWRGGAWERY